MGPNTTRGRILEPWRLTATPAQRLGGRAPTGRRPTVVLTGECTLAGGVDAAIDLNGILFTGHRLRVSAAGGNTLRRLRLQHCTLVPGWSLAADGSPMFPGETSLVVDIPDVIVTIDRSILGSLRTHDGVECRLRDTVLDANGKNAVAYSAADGLSAGGALTLDACTVVGTIHALELPLVSNSILFAELETGSTWPAPIIATRRQQGCVRFSFVPSASRVPRRFRCVPSSDTSTTAAPQFSSVRYGHHAYAQVRSVSGPAILTGASDEGEMGAFHFLCQPQRDTNIRVRLDEYLRVGLEAGIVYES
jgi:hypothetical protein